MTRRVAVITGSGGAMGGAVAVRLAADGADIVLNDRLPDRVDSHRTAAEAHGAQVHSVVASVSRPDGARDLVAVALERFGRIDILVNTVGGLTGPVQAPVWEITDEHWAATLGISLTSAFLCVREVAPTLIAQRSGRIVNIASTSWAPPHAGLHPHYAAAKAGVVAFSEAVALQLVPYDVTVNVVAPGATRASAASPAGPMQERSDDLPPLGRINEPEDVAAAVAYLASPGARNVTGQLITVAGGLNPRL